MRKLPVYFELSGIGGSCHEAVLRFADACSPTTAASDVIPEGARDTNAALEAMVVKLHANGVVHRGIALRLSSPTRKTTSATVTTDVSTAADVVASSAQLATPSV